MCGISAHVVRLYISFLAVGAVNGQPKPPPGPPPQYSKELESELREWLFGSYEINQRPQKKISVKTSLNLLSLNQLDIKEQKLSVTAYFHIKWADSRLRWVDNSSYSNIKFLFSSENYVWKPALIVENSVDDIDVLSKPNVPMRIISMGLIAWMPAGIFTTHCESAITYWPLDSQTCNIIVSSWSYTANEVELEFDDDKAIVTTFYQENGEWELISKTSSSVVTEREFESFSRLVFTLKFRRRPLFHTLNTLFPVVLMGFLTVAIFKLSPESGERVGLALTILLAYAVYLGLISESIPQTSISTSLLSTYLASILFLQTLAVLLTVIYIDVYFTPVDKVVPHWLQFIATSCLSKLACVDCCRRSPKTPLDNMETASCLSKLACVDSCRRSPRTPLDNMEHNIEKNNKIASIEDYEPCKKDAWVDELQEEVKKEEECAKQYSWKEIALLLDKVTMHIYLLFVTVLTVACMSAMLVHYNTAYSVI